MSDEDEVRPERALTLADGVIAIAMTLLALDLKPPAEPGHTSARDLADYLRDHVSQYGSFAIAFAVIAQYWVAHHRIMRPVRRLNGKLSAGNLFFLFGITLIPVTTYMQSNFDGSLGTFLFAINLLIVSVALSAMAMAIHGDRLDGEDETASAAASRRTHAVVVIAIPLLVAGLAWVLGSSASAFFLLFFVPERWFAGIVSRVTAR